MDRAGQAQCVDRGGAEAAPAERGARRQRPCRRLLAPAALLAVLLVVGPTPADGQARRQSPKPSPTPNPMLAQLENVIAELREINATLGTLRTGLADVGARLDRLEAAQGELKGVSTPMREEVRGLYVETSNVRSEIARLEEKSAAEAASVGKSRYVLTLLLVATAVLQLVVLAVLLRSR
ncbi:MAG: hypothetical protein AB1689_01450, partial [Thermodesulfobacteriota bacterium]